MYSKFMEVKLGKIYNVYKTLSLVKTLAEVTFYLLVGSYDFSLDVRPSGCSFLGIISETHIHNAYTYPLGDRYVPFGGFTL